MEITPAEIQRQFPDEDGARELLERARWPNGPVCPHCGSTKVYRLTPNPESRSPGRKGLLKCGDCRKQFTVKVGTIFEDSHILLNKWLQAIYLMCASKKGISALQLQRMLEPITYKSAWFMCHRIRHAMTQQPLAGKLGGIVEADETYIGAKKHGKRGRGAAGKVPVFSLLERDGRARSFVIKDVKAATVKPLIRTHVQGTAYIMTDSYGVYHGLDKEFARHGVVDHEKEYVRGIIHVNFAESYFSLLKRGILGTFHHVSEGHMPLYLNEFDFRWSNRKGTDGERTLLAIKATAGKRMMFREPMAV